MRVRSRPQALIGCRSIDPQGAVCPCSNTSGSSCVRTCAACLIAHCVATNLIPRVSPVIGLLDDVRRAATPIAAVVTAATTNTAASREALLLISERSEPPGTIRPASVMLGDYVDSGATRGPAIYLVSLAPAANVALAVGRWDLGTVDRGHTLRELVTDGYIGVRPCVDRGCGVVLRGAAVDRYLCGGAADVHPQAAEQRVPRHDSVLSTYPGWSGASMPSRLRWDE